MTPRKKRRVLSEQQREELHAQVSKKFRRLSWMDRYPKTEEALEGMIHAYSRFLTFEERTHSALKTDENPDGKVVPGDWLFDKIENGCVKLPAPIDARIIYTEFFPPEDGMEPGDLVPEHEK